MKTETKGEGVFPFLMSRDVVRRLGRRKVHNFSTQTLKGQEKCIGVKWFSCQHLKGCAKGVAADQGSFATNVSVTVIIIIWRAAGSTPGAISLRNTKHIRDQT